MTASKWGTLTELWRNIPPPFRPIDEDLGLYRMACPPQLLAPQSNARILVLGVTPALIQAEWPADCEMHAVDYDEAMIEAQQASGCTVNYHCERWQEMPFPDDHFDLVIGDCSLNALPAIPEYFDVLREVRRVMRDGAPLVCRFFMQASPRLTLTRVAAEADGEFSTFSDAAKRLLIPIAASDEDGSHYARNIANRIREQFGDVDDFLEVLGQTPEGTERAKATFAMDQRLNYPDRDRIETELGQFFSSVKFAFPQYDAGGFCPIVSCN
jgi:ubiquinone/menaquinone biosynthesis C-methylase UbiE